ncbi:MAG: type II toxin-antitoxin system Phd/YefM family antitoxin [Candidatus Acidiferrales bacterium]
MTVVTILEAQKTLSRLIARAMKGEEIVITDGKTPVAKLIAVSAPPKRRAPGRLKGILHVTPQFFEPMSADDVAEWGIE